ncbi:NADP-dependent oxidoreductase [Sphingobium chlorophenolicum]|uniref:2-alkenal reductase n=1 Tax=Sphingobium chlorophenolicum TaxID=46429 RepID=A0A081RAW3_SPHCR|nr:NADP-dependent oxidoreductase [Sphingobium chlorophenolicum]KEQ52336.1 2-alkenal reductase [Sphingobium chlorophenolicum]
MVTSRRIVLAARPEGAVQLSNFRTEEVELPPIQDGQFLVGGNYLSLDPYMRGRMDDRKSYAAPVPVGGVMEGEIIGTVLESRHPGYSVGEKVAGRLGWQSHAVTDGTGMVKLDDRFKPLSTAVGVLGMPGLTAYSGLLTLGKPKPGETVVVAAATGPVGSLVGQIAKIYGARAVGIAGGPEKCAYALEELGFDAMIDHRSPTFAQELAAACPNGIDVYFELVGGAILQAVLPLLNNFARVPVCGLIAQYDGAPSEGVDNLPAAMRIVLSRSVMMRGFIVGEYWDQRPKFLDEVSQWIAEGKVKFREDIVQGLDNAPEAFMGMLKGKNFGKMVVAID